MSTPAQPSPTILNTQPDPGPATPPSQRTNPRGGPNTEAGKTTSSKNAITHGLFATHDFIRPGEHPAYSELAESLRANLVPDGPLELNLVDEIRRAMWRLRRCGQIEESFAAPELDSAPIPDPMQQESTARLQLSVDRARSLSHRLLHKCTAELRKLQTERLFRHEFFDTGTDIAYLGISDVRSIRTGLDKQFVAQLRRDKLKEETELAALLNVPYPPPAAKTSSFCNSVPAQPQAPRNAPCPCGSGVKHKRCCGKNAQAMRSAG